MKRAGRGASRPSGWNPFCTKSWQKEKTGEIFKAVFGIFWALFPTTIGTLLNVLVVDWLGVVLVSAYKRLPVTHKMSYSLFVTLHFLRTCLGMNTLWGLDWLAQWWGDAIHHRRISQQLGSLVEASWVNNSSSWIYFLVFVVDAVCRSWQAHMIGTMFSLKILLNAA